MTIRHQRGHRPGARHPTPPPPPPGEAGTGLIGTIAGVAAFLCFLLFAVQVIVTLYARSTTTAAGYDAARAVASSSVDHDDPAAVARATVAAEARFRDLLGRRGDDATLRWDLGGDSIRLQVTVDAPAILPRSIRDTAGLRRIERTFVVRIERGPT